MGGFDGRFAWIKVVCEQQLGFERIVLLDFIHCLVSQEQTKLRN
jgi:hypothetical protein